MSGMDHPQLRDHGPAVSSANRTAVALPASGSSAARRAAGVRVLAIDDSLTIRKLLEMALAQRWNLELAGTVQDGIAKAKRLPPDLILLDLVLPDGRGTDVLAALNADERTRLVPVVVMTAKGESARELVKGFPQVAECIAKPFTPPEIAGLVEHLTAEREAALRESRTFPALGSTSGSGGPSLSASGMHPAASAAPAARARQEAQARAVYALLKDRLGRIPEWLAAGGAQASGPQAAPFLARRLLTPELIDQLAAVLAPVAETGQAPGLHGSTGLLPVSRLLAEVERWGRTGCLTLIHGPVRTWCWAHKGELRLASRSETDDPQARAAVPPGPDGERLLNEAEVILEQTGKPVVATLLEAGRLAEQEVAAAMPDAGVRALLDAMAAGPGEFSWTDLAALPPWVERLGARIELDQLALERMRTVDDWTQIELEVPGLDAVFHRCAGFASRLDHFRLDPRERTVLTLVDGRRSVRRIIDRSGLPTFEAFHILFRLLQVGLLRRDPASGELALRPVLALLPDAEGEARPLERHLGQAHRPVALALRAGDLAEAIRSQRPALVLVDAAVDGLDLASLLAAVRTDLATSDCRLVAVADDEAQGESLSAAGWDAILIRPWPLAELDRLLAAGVTTRIRRAVRSDQATHSSPLADAPPPNHLAQTSPGASP